MAPPFVNSSVKTSDGTAVPIVNVSVHVSGGGSWTAAKPPVLMLSEPRPTSVSAPRSAPPTMGATLFAPPTVPVESWNSTDPSWRSHTGAAHVERVPVHSRVSTA